VTVLRFDAVRVTRRKQDLLRDVSWRVEPGERWVLLGPNGAGKTTLLRIAGAYEHPTSGTARVLGQTLGRTDVRDLRPRIGLVTAPVARMLRPSLTALQVAWTGARATLGAFDEPSRAELDRAAALLDDLGSGHLADRRFTTLSEGERQRVLIARSLMAAPELLLLDEPAANLDLAGRELLLAAVDRAAASGPTATVLVTQRVEDIPAGFTHALLLRDATVHAAGRIDEVLTAGVLSACFGLPLRVEARDGRYAAWAALP
jgi:iron complex transport system ATP-binding protein